MASGGTHAPDAVAVSPVDATPGGPPPVYVRSNGGAVPEIPPLAWRDKA